MQPAANQRYPNEAQSVCFYMRLCWKIHVSGHVIQAAHTHARERERKREKERYVLMQRHTSLCKKAEKRARAYTERHLKELLRSLRCDGGGAKLRTLDQFLPSCCLWNGRRHKERESFQPLPQSAFLNCIRCPVGPQSLHILDA